jgi:sialidase-1
MKTHLLLLAVGLTTWIAGSKDASAAGPLLTEMDLFISGHDNVNIYRIPSLIVAPSGTVLAIIEARAGDDGDPTDLAVKRSVYSGPQKRPQMLNGYPRVFGYGVNWEPMRIVLSGKGQSVMNPCPVLDRSTGRIWLPCYEVRGGLQEHIKDPYKGRMLLTWSDDEGLTWAPPRDLTHSLPRFIAGPGVGVQLGTGRLIIPGYTDGASCVAYSDDHGQTWRRGAQVKGATDESQAAELSDGVLMLNCRSNRGKACRYVALSRDAGRSWFKEFDEPALPEPVCQASILRLAPADRGGGKSLLVFVNPNDPKDNAAGRVNLTVKVSTDDGKTWSAGRVVHPGPAAYSSIAWLKDGTLGVLYETGKMHPYEKIAFARFNLAWLDVPQADKSWGSRPSAERKSGPEKGDAAAPPAKKSESERRPSKI